MSDEFSFFDDADYNDLEVQIGGYERFRLQAGEHKVVVTKDEVLTKKDGTKTVIVRFANDQGQDFTEYLDPIVPGDEKNFPGKSEKSIRDIKRQKRVNLFVSLGCPRDEIKNWKPGTLTGIEGTLKLYKSKDYIRFGSFVKADGGSVGTPLRQADANPIAGLQEFAAADAGSAGKEFGF